MTVSPFRVVAEDLDLKSSVRDGLEPLLDALNLTLPQLVAAVGQAAGEQFVDVSLVTDAVVADSFPITFRHALTGRPRGVFLAAITPKDTDHDLSLPFVMQGWSLTDNGLVSVPAVTGILPLNSYKLRFWLRG